MCILFMHVFVFQITSLIQGLSHALARWNPQLRIHDAFPECGWIAVGSTALHRDHVVSGFSHLARNVLAATHPSNSTWGMEDGVDLLIAPHGSSFVRIAHTDLEREHVLQSARQCLSHANPCGPYVGRPALAAFFLSKTGIMPTTSQLSGSARTSSWKQPRDTAKVVFRLTVLIKQANTI